MISLILMIIWDALTLLVYKCVMHFKKKKKYSVFNHVHIQDTDSMQRKQKIAWSTRNIS